MSFISDLISNKIEANKRTGLYREIPKINPARHDFKPHSNKNNIFTSKRYKYNSNYNTEFINLATNDYLGLSSDERIKNAIKKAVNTYGTSTSSSFLIYGHSDIHTKLEKKLCEFKGNYENCILYPSGYQANIGVIKALSDISPLKTFIVFDELSHASIIDGILTSGAKFRSFKHNDLNYLSNILYKHRNYEIKMVITEGVFSMDGDIPDLRGILDIAEEYDAVSIVDDAHATGTIGDKGGGSVDFHAVKPDILIGTLGKALASSGAFVLSKRLIIEYLINFSRAFIFSTGMPPTSAAASVKAIDIIKENPEIVKTLQDNSGFARNYLRQCGLNILNSSTHIIPVLIGDENKAVLIEKGLLEAGIYLKAIRYPAVPKKKARLRLGINTSINITALENALKILVNTYDKQTKS